MAQSPATAQRLVGSYVELRPLMVDDAAITCAWRNSRRAAQLNAAAPDAAAQARWIAARPASEFNFIIETKQARPIGMLSLTGIDRNSGIGEPGRFLIGDETAARGIPAAAEAMLLLYQLAFDQLDLRRVWGFVASNNTRMLKWQKFLGMREEGRLRAHLLIDGCIQDAVLFGLLQPEYRAKTERLLRALVAAGAQAIAANSHKD